MIRGIVGLSGRGWRSLRMKNHNEFFWIFKSRAQKFKQTIENAEKAMKMNSFEEALELFEDSLKLDDPEKPQADKILKNMATAHLSMNQIDQSIKCYIQLSEKYPNDQNIQIAMGLLYGKSGNQEKAMQIFEEVLSKDQKNTQVIHQVALYYEQLQLIDKAIESYKRSIDINPNDALPYIHIGYIYLRILNDVEHALQYLIKAKELEPDNIDLIYNIGMCYFELKNSDLAIQNLNRCLEIDPSFHDAKRNLRFINQLLNRD